MLQSGLISADENQHANTPLREIKRREEFQAQIDELFTYNELFVRLNRHIVY